MSLFGSADRYTILNDLVSRVVQADNTAKKVHTLPSFVVLEVKHTSDR